MSFHRPLSYEFSATEDYALKGTLKFGYTPDPDIYGLDAVANVGVVSDLPSLVVVLNEFEADINAGANGSTDLKKQTDAGVPVERDLVGATLKVGVSGPYPYAHAYALRDLLVAEGFGPTP